MRVVAQFLKHVLPGIIKPVRILWNEVIGFVFLVLAGFFGLATYRKMDDLSGEFHGLLYLAASFFFVAVLAGFGISSFLRARKIGRQ
jgi:hypothetical protein